MALLLDFVVNQNPKIKNAIYLNTIFRGLKLCDTIVCAIINQIFKVVFDFFFFFAIGEK